MTFSSARLRRSRIVCANAGVSIDKIDELVLVGGMTRMPKVVETAHSLVNKPPHQGLNPDEVVAVGAAIPSRCA
jgi:molecular chaperone DnaK